MQTEETEKYLNQDESYVEEAPRHTSTGGIIGLIILIVILVFLFKPKWTLFVCSTLQNEGYRYECNENALVLENAYRSLNKCSEAGRSYLSKYPGFECGYKCDFTHSYGLTVCKKLSH